MENVIQLNARFIRGYLKHLKVPPQVFEVPGPFGLKVPVTLEPTELRLEEDAILIPLQIPKFPDPFLRLHRFKLVNRHLWFEVDTVHLGPFKLPVSRLVRHLLRLVLPAEGTFVNEGNRFGLDVHALVADKHCLQITDVAIAHGIRVTFSLPVDL